MRYSPTGGRQKEKLVLCLRKTVKPKVFQHEKAFSSSKAITLIFNRDKALVLRACKKIILPTLHPIFGPSSSVPEHEKSSEYFSIPVVFRVPERSNLNQIWAHTWQPYFFTGLSIMPVLSYTRFGFVF